MILNFVTAVDALVVMSLIWTLCGNGLFIMRKRVVGVSMLLLLAGGWMDAAGVAGLEVVV